MRKKLGLFLTLVLVLNSYSVAAAAEIVGSSAFENALKAESSVISFFLVTTLPLKLVSVTLNEEYSLLNTAGGPAKTENSKKKNGKNTSASYFAFAPVEENVRFASTGIGNTVVSLFDKAALHSSDRSYASAAQGPGQGEFVFLLLLLYIICLSLSNLPLPVMNHLYKILRTRLCTVQPGSFFCTSSGGENEL